MSELFRRNGYHTVCIGKVSHTPDGRVFSYDGKGRGQPEVPHAWDELATPYGKWDRGWGRSLPTKGEDTGKTARAIWTLWSSRPNKTKICRMVYWPKRLSTN